jgi:hypothetical protein
VQHGVDNRLVGESGAEQSVEVAEAAWIAGRLSPFLAGVVTSVVPAGAGSLSTIPIACEAS